MGDDSSNVYLRGGDPSFSRSRPPMPGRWSSRGKTADEVGTQDEDDESGEEGNGYYRQRERRLERRRQVETWLPPGGDYEVAPLDILRQAKHEMLGIEECPLQPGPRRFGGTGENVAQRAELWILDWTRQRGWRTLAELRSDWSQRGKGEWWHPTRLGLEREWHKDEEPTEWFEYLYIHLYVRVEDLVKAYFNYDDISGENREGIWLNFSPQFRYYASLVACQDNHVGGWDELLASRLHRKYLITGILGKALEMSVFGELMFGADLKQVVMLQAEDEGTLYLEGYKRTELRSRSVRALLAGETLPPLFWNQVDWVSMQLTKLLLPAVRLMDVNFEASRRQSLRRIHQDIHSIVAVAGFLSIGIRWSPNIFRFSSPVPGEAWGSDQQHVDDTIYKMSRAVADRLGRRAERKWRKDRQDRQQQQQLQEQRLQRQRQRQRQLRQAGERGGLPGLVNNVIAGTDRIWNMVKTQVQSRIRVPGSRLEGAGVVTRDFAGDGRDYFNPPSRMGKVQIVLWPMLKRYTAKQSPEADPDGWIPMGYDEGETITSILKAQVVYYEGEINSEGEDAEGHPTLEEWIRHRRWVVSWRQQQFLRQLALAVVVWLILDGLASYFGGAFLAFRNTVEYFMAALGRWILKKIVVWTLGVLISITSLSVALSKVAWWFAYATRNTIVDLIGMLTRWDSNAPGQIWLPPRYHLDWASFRDLIRILRGDLGSWWRGMPPVPPEDVDI